jgi:hypothetical protein
MRRCTRVAAWMAFWASCSGEAIAGDPALAEEHFQRGVKEMKAGNYQVACPALAESERLEPRPGTLFALADCEAQWGKVATAVTHFKDYLTRVSQLTGAARAPHRERVRLANARLKDLAEKVPQLTLVAPRDAPSGLEVRRDDVVLGAPSLGVPLPIDPGRHVVTTQAPGGKVHEMAVELAPGEKKTVELVVLEASQALAPAAQTPDTQSQSEPAPSSRGTIGLVIGGVGLAGIAVGAVAGVLALGHKSTVDDKCPDALCSGDGLDDVDALETTAMVSNIGFIAGGALLVGGAVLFFTAPSSSAKAEATGWRWTSTVGPRRAMVGVGRSW